MKNDTSKKKGFLGAIWETVSGESCGCSPGSNCCSTKVETGEAKPDSDRKKNTLRVYDPPMCCSSGVCGTNVNSALVEFAGALKHLTKCGVEVERWNLAQQPQAFAENSQVKELLSELGKDGLPFIFVNDELKISGRYPKTGELFDLLGLNDEAEISGSCCSERSCR